MRSGFAQIRVITDAGRQIDRLRMMESCEPQANSGILHDALYVGGWTGPRGCVSSGSRGRCVTMSPTPRSSRLLSLVIVFMILAFSQHADATCVSLPEGYCSAPGGPVHCSDTNMWEAHPGVRGEVGVGFATQLGNQTELGLRAGGIRVRVRQEDASRLRHALVGSAWGIEAFGDLGRADEQRYGGVAFRFTSEASIGRVRLPSMLGIALGELDFMFGKGRAQLTRYHFVRLPVSIMLTRSFTAHAEVTAFVDRTDERSFGASMRIELRATF